MASCSQPIPGGSWQKLKVRNCMYMSLHPQSGRFKTDAPCITEQLDTFSQFPYVITYSQGCAHYKLVIMSLCGTSCPLSRPGAAELVSLLRRVSQVWVMGRELHCGCLPRGGIEREVAGRIRPRPWGKWMILLSLLEDFPLRLHSFSFLSFKN